MFGSDVVNTLLWQELSAIPAVTDTVDDRLHSIDIAPGPLPALLYHPSTSSYDSTVGSDPTFEALTYQVRLICEGDSTAPIREAAFAQLALLGDGRFQIAIDGATYFITFAATGESIPTTVYEGGTYYRLLGTTYAVHVTKG